MNVWRKRQILLLSLLQNTDWIPEFFAAEGESGGCRRPFLA